MTAEEATALGNPTAKMLVHLIVDRIVTSGVRTLPDSGERKALSGYAQLYLDTKSKYAMRVHTAPCPGGASTASPTGRSRCKVDGRYAEVGDPFQPGHIDAIAKRRVGKEVLKDLWVASGGV